MTVGKSGGQNKNNMQGPAVEGNCSAAGDYKNTYKSKSHLSKIVVDNLCSIMLFA